MKNYKLSEIVELLEGIREANKTMTKEELDAVLLRFILELKYEL